MDFKDMKEQFAEKAKEELMEKVDEVKQDIEKRFGGGSEQQSSENRSDSQQDVGSRNSEDVMRDEESNIPVSSDDKQEAQVGNRMAGTADDEVDSTTVDKDEDAA